MTILINQDYIQKNWDVTSNRFWSKVDIRGEDECWEWKAGIYKRGYGAFGAYKKHYKAHRFSWMLNYGNIPDGLSVCHKCDNPKCVNPNHLFLGTAKDNIKDCAEKGRRVFALGEKHGHSKLTLLEVKEILRLNADGKLTQTEIAKKFNLDHRHVHSIIKKRIWKWVEIE